MMPVSYLHSIQLIPLLDSSFKTAAFKLKTGEITTTPVKTQYGYHVIKMIKHPAKGTLKRTQEAN